MTQASQTLGTVYWEDDPSRVREVIRMCKRCCAVDPSFVFESVNDVMIVSPSGLGHHSSGYGVTDCGIDATGPDWWWRL
jgi:hypothetical protein